MSLILQAAGFKKPEEEWAEVTDQINCAVQLAPNMLPDARISIDTGAPASGSTKGRAYKFKVATTDTPATACFHGRSEVGLGNPSRTGFPRWAAGEEIWLAFEFCLAKNFPFNNNNCHFGTVMQFHEEGGTSSPPFLMQIGQHSFSEHAGGPETGDMWISFKKLAGSSTTGTDFEHVLLTETAGFPGKISPETWYRVVVHAKFTSGIKNGIIEVYLGTKAGGTPSLVYSNTACWLGNSENQPTHLRFGNYPATERSETPLMESWGAGMTVATDRATAENGAFNSTSPGVTKPADQSNLIGETANLAVAATETTEYKAVGLPPGLAINGATGVITGTPSTAGKYEPTITVKGAGGEVTTAFKWTIKSEAGPEEAFEYPPTVWADKAGMFANAALLNKMENGIVGVLGVANAAKQAAKSVSSQVRLVGSNTAVGQIALQETAATESVGVGYEAGAQAEGAGNTAVGAYAYALNELGRFNVAVGQRALGEGKTGEENVAVGYKALAVTTVSQQVAVGAFALKAATTGKENVAVGSAALFTNATGSRNTAVGWSALKLATVSDSTAVGAAALTTATGAANTAVGSKAGKAVTTGENNTAIGAEALLTATTTSQATVVGAFAGKEATGGELTAVGYSAAKAATGSRNTAVGVFAGNALTTGGENVAVGAGSLTTNKEGTQNVALGTDALSKTTVSKSTAVGTGALKLASTGSENTAVGYHAAEANTTGAENVAVGSIALTTNKVGSKNTAVGWGAGQEAVGSSNVFLGYNAGKAEAGSNMLYIANSATQVLIKGEFSAATPKLGLYGVEPVVRFGKIAEPAETLAGHQAAIKSIREALFGIGVTTP